MNNLPKLVLLAYDARNFVYPGVAYEAYAALVAGRLVSTSPAPLMGKDRHCWINIERLVEKRGGQLVMGSNQVMHTLDERDGVGTFGV